MGVDDRSRTIYAAIEDTNFVHAVQAGTESFRKGDILHVKLQTRQWMEGGELKAEHSIVQVLNHQNAPEQRKLFLPRGEDSDAES